MNSHQNVKSQEKKLLLGLILLLLFACATHGGTPFEWLNNLDDARTIAAEQEKPLLIVFRCEP
jgi:hypothetical protein